MGNTFLGFATERCTQANKKEQDEDEEVRYFNQGKNDIQKLIDYVISKNNTTQKID